MRDRPFSDRCSNPGFHDRWTCPGFYADLDAANPGTVTCSSCGRKVLLSVDYEPVSIAELIEDHHD